MSRRRKGRPGAVHDYKTNPGNRHWSTECGDCGKRSYRDRQHAKEAIRVTPGNRGMREYRCPVDDGVWHVGHLPMAVRWGVTSSDEYYAKPETNTEEQP